MERNEVMQAYYIRKEIKMWEDELAQLKENSEAKAAPTYIQGGRSENMPSDPTGGTVAQRAGIEEKIIKLLKKAKVAEENIAEYVNTIDDSLERQIVFYRCIKCLSWIKVAHKIGGGNTADGVRMRFDRMFPKKKSGK